MLRSIKCKNPKTFWNDLNTKTDSHKHDKQPDCENFANMFKNLGTSINNDDVNNEKPIHFLRYMDINMYIRDYSILDKYFTYGEVRDTIKDLKPNKAHGLDLIINEFF